MELDDFLRSLLKRWYVFVFLVGVAVVGVGIYHQSTATPTAQATVAVLDPLIARPGGFTQAQVPFDSLIKSKKLSEQVAARLNDGTAPEEIQARLSVRLQPTLFRINPSPLYAVRASHPDPNRAILLANLAVEEGKKLFGEVNKASGAEVRRAFEEEFARAEAEVAETRGQYSDFLQLNDAYSLPLRVQQQMTLITDLKRQRYMVALGEATAGFAGEGPSLEGNRAELGRLVSLEPEYNALAFAVKLAQDDVTQRETQVRNLTTGGSTFEEALSVARQQQNAAERRLAEAEANFNSFKRRNGVADLPTTIRDQLAAVNRLTVAQATLAGSTEVLDVALLAEERELGRLRGLEREYNAHDLRLQQAQIRLSQLQTSAVGLIVGQTLPAGAQVKIVDSATLEWGLWRLILTLGLGVIVALLLAFSLVYMMAYFEPKPLTAEMVERELKAPVLARLPRASR